MHMVKSGTRSWFAAVILTGSLCAPVARATSSQLIDQGGAGGGSAHAGEAARAEDLSTMFFNPAGLAAISRRTPEFEVGSVFFDVETRTRGQGSFAQGIAYDPGRGVGRTEVRRPSAAFYASTEIGDPELERLRIGVAVNAPFGFRNDYEPDWVGRYHADKSTLRVINIQPTLAFGQGSWSVGAGVVISSAVSEQSGALDLGLIGSLDGSCPNCVPGSRVADGKVSAETSDVTVGYAFGVHWGQPAGLALGVSYRSKLDFELEGDARFSSRLGESTVDVRSEVTLPSVISVAAAYGHGEWRVYADTTLTRWGHDAQDQIRARFVGSNLPDAVEAYGLRDSWRRSIGFSWRALPSVSLRAGYSFDETASRGTRGRSPRTGDEDARHYAIGASVHGVLHGAADVHLYVKVVDMDEFALDATDELGHRLEARSRWSWATYGLGISFHGGLAGGR